jgi:hypothetical protein
VQIGTTKGTGGDVLILEEAAYCDEGFFYETVAPILSIGSASLVAISTLTSEINFYTRLIQMVDPGTERPLFAIRCIELCCERCKADGKQAECVHMLHLVPMWQSEERHRKLKIMMQDRPDLIQSELAGLAFDSLQQVFRKSDIAIAMALKPLPMPDNPFVFLVIDPAAGGPQSDYAVVSIVRERGSVTVSSRESPRTPSQATDHMSWHRLRVPAEVHEEVCALALLHRRLAVDDRPLHLGVDVEQQEEERQRLDVREAVCLDAFADVADGGVLGRHVVLLADARQALQAVVLHVRVVHGHQDPRDEMRHALGLRGARCVCFRC